MLVANHDQGAIESGQRFSRHALDSTELDRGLPSIRCCTEVGFKSWFDVLSVFDVRGVDHW